MGKLFEIILKKQKEIREELALPLPDPVIDPGKTMEAIRRRNDLAYIRDEMGLEIKRLILLLTPEQQQAFYEHVPKVGRFPLSFEDFRNALQKKDFEGGFLLNDKRFGEEPEQLVAVLEEMLDQKAADEASERVEKIIPPSHPDFPLQNKLRHDHQQDVNDRKAFFTDNVPRAKETREYLDQVNELLSAPTARMSSYIDRMDNEIQPVADKVSYVNSHRYFENNENARKLTAKIPTTKPGGVDFRVLAPEVTPGTALSEDDIRQMKEFRPEISDETEQEILKVTDLMDEIGEDAYKIPNVTTMELPKGSGKYYFKSEQSTKHYAFWPLVRERTGLAETLKYDNIAAIRNNEKRYSRVRGITDQMMAIVKKNPSPICGGNVNSTRTSGGAESPIPLEYQEDFVSHSKLNGIYLLYGLSKNINKPVRELIEDPVTALAGAADTFVRENGLKGKGTAVDKLLNCLDENACDDFDRVWTQGYSTLAMRAFDAASAMGRNDKERQQIAGVGQLAIAASTSTVGKEKDLWQSVLNAEDEKKAVLYQHALLLDDDAFDPAELAGKLQRPGWKGELSEDKLIGKLRAEGKLDMDRLADRCGEMLQKAEQRSDDAFQKARPFNLDKNGFRQQHYNLSKKVLRTATPEERETEGFIKLQEFIEKLEYNESDKEKLNMLSGQLEQNLAVQQQEKSGWFLSSENTLEHKRMTFCQQMLNCKLRMLRGEEVGDVSPELRQKIRKTSVATLLDNAREATFQYCALKTKNGKNLTFRHDVGKLRYDKALDSITKMDALANELGTRTPAKRSMDTLRLRALKNRHTEGWTEEHAEDSAVRIMYAMTVEFKYPEKEKQSRFMKSENAQEGARALLQDKAFVRLTEKLDDDELVDKLIEGGGKLTDAYIKSLNEVKKEVGQAQGKAPKDMTREEKTEIWAKRGPV